VKVRVEDIKYVKDFYPRGGIDNTYLDLLKLAPFESLPPILVNQDMILVDGNHTLTLAKTLGKKEVEVEQEEIAENDLLKRAVERNAIHGHQLTPGEKRNVILRLYKLGFKEVTQLAAIVGVDLTTVNRVTSDLRKEETEARNEKVLDLWLEGYTQESYKKRSDGYVRRIGGANDLQDTP